MNIDVITMEELIWAIRELKRNKVHGPDGVPVECYKDMQEDQLKCILNLFNHWWEGNAIESEATRAQVILIYKKGDKNNLANYRPISLLNTNYKLYIAILQKRLADVLDPHLQNTQYGFRANRGTINALHYIRRIVEKSEKTEAKTLLVLLDLEKAFDQVIHTKLIDALKRMNVPGKMTSAIQELYRQPTFRASMENVDGDWTKQETGIRQGCPRSPYLILIFMSRLF